MDNNQAFSEQQAGTHVNTGNLTTDRKLLKVVLLSIITLGIYGIYFIFSVKRDLNVLCGEHNEPKTMNLLPLFLLSLVTAGIASLVWYHRISNRIGRELRTRNILYSFGASDFWLWNVLGSLIIVGPFVYMHKMCTAMNYLCSDYNSRG